MNKLSIIITTFNSMKYLPDFIDSIFKQTYYQARQTNPDIFIVDNASSDQTVTIIKSNLPTVHKLRNVKNIGLPRAWNQAIKITNSEYILVMNPDIILEPNFIERALNSIAKDQTIASLGGKLHQLKVAGNTEDDLNILVKTKILDSCGLQGLTNRRFIERGAGQEDKGQFDKAEEVFGISGACVLYRRSALAKIKFGEEYFDEDFFIYKEDIDMAWRLRLTGYTALYNPTCIAYHHRRARSLGAKASDLTTAKHRLTKDKFVNDYSYRNHLLLLKKNEFAINIFKHFPSIFWYELKKIVYLLILEFPTLIKTLRDIHKLKPKFKQKRQLNMKLAAIKPEVIDSWFI